MSDVNNYGFKVSKSGAEVESTDPRDILLSSSYNMLKQHMDVSQVLTFNPGDTHQFFDITHNLGYVPAFIAYAQDFNDGKEHFIPAIPYGTSFNAHYYAFSDNTKVRAGLVWDSLSYGEHQFAVTDFWSTIFGSNAATEVGNDTGTSTSGAFRFNNVNIPQGTTIISAAINYFVGVKGAGTGDLRTTTYGIAEDNTSDFGGDPMGRTKTSHSVSQTNVLTQNQFFGINVKDIVQEIINRSGWASGNALGFLIFDNGSPNNVYAFDANAGTNSFLDIVYGSSFGTTIRVIIFKDQLSA